MGNRTHVLAWHFGSLPSRSPFSLAASDLKWEALAIWERKVRHLHPLENTSATFLTQ